MVYRRGKFCNFVCRFQNVHHLGPATDFYKKLALDCSAQQIAVDMFLLNSQYADIASIGNYNFMCLSCTKFTQYTLGLCKKYHITNIYVTFQLAYQSIQEGP